MGVGQGTPTSSTEEGKDKGRGQDMEDVTGQAQAARGCKLKVECWPVLIKDLWHVMVKLTYDHLEF